MKKILAALRESKCGVENVNSSGIVEGSSPDILELMKQMMLRFSVSDKAEIAKWVNKALSAEGLKIIVAENSLAAGFTNGVAFCALVNYVLRSQRQDDLCVDLSSLTSNMGISNFNLAMVRSFSKSTKNNNCCFLGLGSAVSCWSAADLVAR
jgi:hypothetical protein